MKMSLSPLVRYRLNTVLTMTLVWVITGVVIEVNNALAYDALTGRYTAYFPFGNSAFEHLLITAVGPLIGGLAGGSLIVFVLRERLRKRSFANKLVVQSLTFLGLIFLLIMLVGSIQASTMAGPFGDNFIAVVFTWRVFRLVITWFVVVVVTLLVLDVSDKYGKGVLMKIITGKYHQPVREERVFLFMDLRDSTSLAENMGEQKYFNLLRAVYFLVTEPVLDCEGEVQQYVGDEIVITWPAERGLRNANCLNCFYRISSVIADRTSDFMDEFGIVPEFKGAIHMGHVVVGELGVIKKEIVYAGDVLNSTSRILNLAKQQGETLLVSEQIEKAIKGNGFRFGFIDNFRLKGKSQESAIFRVLPPPQISS